MKLVDMVGVRLPFVAFYYPTICELLGDDNVADTTFRNSEELAQQ